MKGLLLGACLLLNQATAQSEGIRPWETLYEDEDASGESVIGLWQFLPGHAAEDISGNGHTLTLRGQSSFVEGGRFGHCLESFPGDKDNDHPQGAYAQNHPDLSPSGAFTLELWIKARPEIEEYGNVFLLDKKYYHYAKDLPQANKDYCLYLHRTGEHRRVLVAYLGFGADSAEFRSNEFELLPGTWYHVAFSYDGKGTGRFFLDGAAIGRRVHEGRKGIAPGPYHLVIGDRYGSIYSGFPGTIDQVRICRTMLPCFSGVLEITPDKGRLSFVRMEKEAQVSLVVLNDTPQVLKEVALQWKWEESQGNDLMDLLPAGESHGISVPIDTKLRPGTYELYASAEAQGPSQPHKAEARLTVTVVPRPLPHVMPVLMWGTGDLDTLKEIGFTHHLVHLADYQRIWDEGASTEAAVSSQWSRYQRMLDECLAKGIGAAVVLYPGRWVMRKDDLKERFQRVDRRGEPRVHDNACAAHPDLLRFGKDVGTSVARTFASHPGLQASLIHSEIRDHTDLCFHEFDKQNFRDYAGFDIPEQAVSKGGVRWESLPDFPLDRLISDDHPLLLFYKWFWKEGDGWNWLHTRVHEGLHSTGRQDLWTFFDPAVRAPSIWGSGGEVDVLSQWTYSYPDPIKIGQATDELFAMAEGVPGQQVMKMTQVIWYRSQTAPELPEDESKRVSWEKEIPDARFITIAPDHLREAFWSKISRPIRGIMYHGWASLVPSQHGSYRYTNGETKTVLTELTRTVVKPLGPTLLQVSDRKADVALLESFSSQMFAGRGTRGWSGSWEADMHLILQWAHMQPKIVYEETILRDGLDDFKVLVMPFCDVLPKTVFERVFDFQRKGGILIADEYLVPALSPDILVRTYHRTKLPHTDKVILQERARLLRRELDPFYAGYGEASEQDVVLRFRRSGETDYLFALNDRREYGNYVGHHKRVMERGLPIESDIEVRRKKGHIYDLVQHQEVEAKRKKGHLFFHAAFRPGGGRLFMITSRPLRRLAMEMPEKAFLGESFSFEVRVTGPRDEIVDAVVPIHVEILDPEGRQAEGSGYYGAAQGQLSRQVDLASNDLTGEWTLRVTELAAGHTQLKRIPVRRR